MYTTTPRPYSKYTKFYHMNTFLNRKCDKHLLNNWDGCEKYYLKSIARYGHLQAAMKNPSPQLGVQNLERIRGFSTHLLVSFYY